MMQGFFFQMIDYSRTIMSTRFPVAFVPSIVRFLFIVWDSSIIWPTHYNIFFVWKHHLQALAPVQLLIVFAFNFRSSKISSRQKGSLIAYRNSFQLIREFLSEKRASRSTPAISDTDLVCSPHPPYLPVVMGESLIIIVLSARFLSLIKQLPSSFPQTTEFFIPPDIASCCFPSLQDNSTQRPPEYIPAISGWTPPLLQNFLLRSTFVLKRYTDSPYTSTCL